MDIPFVHLHCHSHYSLLDGAGRISDLLQRAKDLEMPALALTDHGNLFGALEFYKTAGQLGVKPIIGFEAYIASDHRTNRTAGMDNETFHLTLLALNRTGYRNLLKLSSKAFLEGMYRKPRIDKELLQEYHEGLICLSGCASSELSRAILGAENGGLDKALGTANWYRDLFGDRYYLELQDNGLEIQKIVFEGTLKVAEELGIPTVATNDVHYVHQKDWEAQDILLCVNTKKLRVDEKRMRMDSDQFYLRSGREMLQAMPGHEDAIRRSVEIAERIDCDLELGKRYFPVFTPPDDLTSDDYLRKLCLEGLKRRYSDNAKRCKDGVLSDEVLARLDRELSVISKLGFPNYFLIVWDFVRVAEERGIHRTARGSGVGALVCYALGMSHVCPLEFDLLFERFLDENRIEAPDIDIDFDQDRRSEILDYVKEKYGEANVAQIGTFMTMAAKNSIKDVGRVLNVPIPEVNSVTKLIPNVPKMTIKKALGENIELKKRYDNERDVTELIDYAKQLEGLVRGVSTHACAVVIADKPLTTYLPLKREEKGGEGIVTQWQMGDVEAAGLLKMDFLGLRNLSILAQAIEFVERTRGEKIDPYRFPLDDQETFQLLCRGETMGVFQLESPGMRGLLMRMRPDNFRDIIATLALYRPGPLEGGMVDQYVKVKHGEIKAEYVHPVMEEVLAETNGVMVYQEQIMRILNKLGKIPLGEAYTVIKAISKKKEDKIDKSRQQFVEGACENGLEKKQAEEIFELIIKFAGYGFNKSHSTAYALVAYMTAYLKTHYTVEYMAALLNGDISKRNFTKKDDVVFHIEDSQRMGIEVLNPDINTSTQSFSPLEDNRIAFALTAVKGCGEWAADKIVQAREQGGPFKDLYDFCERIDGRACPRATVETLIKAGAFDSLGAYRSQLMQILDQAWKAGGAAKEDLARGQKSLFSLFEDEPEDVHAKSPALAGLPDIPEWSDKEKAMYEKETVGYYISSHPLKELEPLFQQFRTHICAEATELPERTQVILAGMICEYGVRTTKKGEPRPYANFTLEDATGTIRSTIWPEAYALYSRHLKSDTIVFIVGRIDRRNQDNNDSAGSEDSVEMPAEKSDGELIVNEVLTLEDAPERFTRGMVVSLDESRHSVDKVKTLYEILRGYPGQGSLEISVRLQNGTTAFLRGSKMGVAMNSEMRERVNTLLGGDSVRLLKAALPTPKDQGPRRPWRRDG